MSNSSPGLDASLCPTTKQLKQWLDGDIELDADSVSHVQRCQRCAQVMSSLSDDDGLYQLVQGSRVAINFDRDEEPELTRLRARLNDWPLDQPVARPGLSEGDASTVRSEPALTDADHPSSSSSDSGSSHSSIEVLSIAALQRRLPQGRWSVDHLLATGGSGAVYLAYDQRLQREVAIKVLARDSMRDRQRFLREARLLAELEHPNIVRVFDFGTLVSPEETITAQAHTALESDSSGRTTAAVKSQLYIVLEYVPGGTANALRAGQPAWDSHSLNSKRGRMDYQRLAGLLATAADGLATAHARGLVHRDVKPGNLLLDDSWSAIKVADFGLARLTDVDATQVTRSGDLLGTPDFMSPEQVTVHGNITAASDIYSLGATLYQLLVGIAPYQGGAAAVLRQIAESTPAAPRLIAPWLPVDLETICMKAMQFEPSARYASMQEFAGDLRAFASGEAIRARPVSTLGRAMRFLRRNPSLATLLLVCAGLVGLLTAGSIGAAIVFGRQNSELKLAIDNQRAAKNSAENALKASVAAADQLLLAVTTETEFLPRAPGSQQVSRKLLERARDYFRSFLDTHSGNPLLTYQLARAHAGLAQVASRVGDTAALESETQSALSLIEQIPDGEIQADQRAALKADVLVVLANYLTESAEAKKAIPLLEDAASSCLAHLKSSSSVPRTSASASEQPRDLRASYAYALFGLGNAMTWVGQRAEAEPKILEARSLFEKLSDDYPQNTAYLRTLATCEMTLATIALDLNRAADGKQHLQKVIALLAKVDVADALSLRAAELKIKALTNMALAERRLGNNAEAKAGYEQAMAESQRLIELEPSVTSHKWNLVVAAMNSGGPEIELGNLEALIKRWQATVPVLDQLLAIDPDNQRYQQVKAMLQSNIAIILRDLGKLNEAIEPLQAATETLQKLAAQLDYSPPTYLPVAVNHYELASTFVQLERWTEAEQALDQSDHVVDRILSKDPAFTPARSHRLDTMHTRLVLLAQRGDVNFESREKLAQESLDLALALAAEQPEVAEFQVEIPRAHCDLARVHLDAKRYQAAAQTARQAYKLLLQLAESKTKAAEPSADANSNPPEWRECMKKAVLIQARAMVGTSDRPLNADDQSILNDLLQQGRAAGISEAELAEFIKAKP